MTVFVYPVLLVLNLFIEFGVKKQIFTTNFYFMSTPIGKGIF